jgi:DNA-binding transcriptional MocR family regulator
LAELADGKGLVVTPGHRFFVDGGGERYLRLPYTHTTDVLDEAVRRLADAWRSAQSSSTLLRRSGSGIDLSA